MDADADNRGFVLDRYYYLNLILIWAMPVVVLQWLLGLDILAKRWKVWLFGILIPTIYLTGVEALALRSQSWTINPTQTTGALIPLLDIPIEEGVFVLVIDTLIVQGLILLMYSQRIGNRVRRLLQLIRRGPAALRVPEQNSGARKTEN
jgi:lycopene cyclase domain-containing protein